MDKDFTYIGILLDASSSMFSSADSVRAGFNDFIEEQKKLPGRAQLNIAQFADTYVPIVRHVDLKAVGPLTKETYAPQGNTALADSAMQLINDVGAHLEKMPEAERPANVIILIFSDGQENRSKQFSMEQVRAKVEHQKETYSWKFLLLGMELDAQALGNKIGVRGISLNRNAAEIKTSGLVANAYVGATRLCLDDIAESVLLSEKVDDDQMKGTLRSYSERTNKT